MPFSYIKILLYCNKNSPISISSLRNEFKMTRNEAHALISELKELGYIYYVGDSSVSTTYKGRTVLQSSILEWLSIHIVPILALVLSIISFIRTL